MEGRKGPAIGIDLGTAYTRVALFDGRSFQMIPDDHGNPAMPSYVAFTDSGVLVGAAAKNQAMQNPTNTIFDVIRLIGRRYSHPSIRNDIRLWPFKVIASQNDSLLVEISWEGKLWQFTPVEICSMILTQIKVNTEKNLGVTIADAVITVPVCFNYEQRKAIKEAGMIAGFNVMQLVSTSSASALFYSSERQSKISSLLTKSEVEEYNMFIFDLGAGTLDVSLITLQEDVCIVRATAGNAHLGGSDFDNNMIYYFLDLLRIREQKDISNICRAVSELRKVCETAKAALSSGSKIMVIGPIYNNPIFRVSITAEEYNELSKELFAKCIDTIDTCLRDAKVGADIVDEVILFGGSTRIPLLQAQIKQYFNGKELKISNHLGTAVAFGAALQASFLCTRRYERVNCLSLLDATSFSLGMQSSQGLMYVLIPKGTTIPTRTERMCRYYNQTTLVVEVYEGEGRMTSENNLLGKLVLPGSSFSPNGRDFKVCFEVDVSGTLTVTAEESSTGIRNNITFTINNIEDSQKRVWNAFLYKKGEKISKEQSEKTMGHSSRQYVEQEEHAIGIDFGTTYSCVAVWQRNEVEIIENEYGSPVTSSSVAFTDAGLLIVDEEQVMINPTNAIPNIKRLIGRCYSDPTVASGKIFRPFGVRRGNNNRVMLSVQYKGEEKNFAPEEIAAMVLSKLKKNAESHLSSKVTKAVISVPACFNDSQRKAIKDAGAIAGLNVMQLLNEPTAAAIAYYDSQEMHDAMPKTLLIFDLGGGNLDVSIVELNAGTIQVRAVVGYTNLGGQDFDENLVCHFVKKFMKEKNSDISNKPKSLRRLRAACERAKIALSTDVHTVVEIDALDNGIDFRGVITRAAFEELNRSLFKRSMDCVERCLEEARMGNSSIDEVVLVGRSTRMPMVQQLLQDFFKGKKLCKNTNADAVAYGAAVRAAILSGKSNILKLQDITSLPFGLISNNGAIMNMLIPKHTPIPAKKELQITAFSDHQSCFSVEVLECEVASMIVFSLSGITPQPRSNSKINLSFEVDDSGIINLTAKNTSMSEKSEIVTSKKNVDDLTPEEIERVLDAASRYKTGAEGHNIMAAAVGMYSLKSMTYSMKAAARDPKLSASNKKLMEEAADKAIAWMDTNHHAEIEEINAWKRVLEIIKSQVNLVLL
ncbi:Heat shock 70 kDa protein [Rhynchospora pubera]|uniref:Heat shock 70 kDa protein n=1 Tax=Rhynchospora pubera TaxID=906938 RepID=A0AAV8GEP5_9POAL|nr:Heat shock 70 kDa protein [Rhynchospora pubera]